MICKKRQDRDTSVRSKPCPYVRFLDESFLECSALAEPFVYRKTRGILLGLPKGRVEKPSCWCENWIPAREWFGNSNSRTNLKTAKALAWLNLGRVGVAVNMDVGGIFAQTKGRVEKVIF